MPKIIVAIGSMRRPKLNAVWEALTVIGPSLDADAQFEVEGADVPSSVSHTPLSRAEIMRGACNRAKSLATLARERNLVWRYFLGLEGGLDVVVENGSRLAFLQSWACVMDTAGITSYGQSGGVLLPERLASEVIDQGVELGVAIDAFAGGEGIRDSQGAWGVLTRDMITRRDAFRVAVINAFAPFFNRRLYEKGTPKRV